jgi:Domain of unknown function (DUF4276)
MRVKIVCEGETERDFVKRVLAPSFEPREIELRPNDTGGNHYPRVRGDILKALAEKPAYDLVTTMYDYYGLPPTFPGYQRPTAAKGDPYSRVARVEEAFARDIDDARFLPGGR